VAAVDVFSTDADLKTFTSEIHLATANLYFTHLGENAVLGNYSWAKGSNPFYFEVPEHFPDGTSASGLSSAAPKSPDRVSERTTSSPENMPPDSPAQALSPPMGAVSKADLALLN